MPDLSVTQLDAVRNLLLRLSPGLALALSEQLNVEVKLELTDVRTAPLTALLARQETVFQTQFTLSQSQGAESVFLYSVETAQVLARLIQGQPPSDTPSDLTDAQVETLSDAMNSLVRGFATGLGNLTGDNYDVESSFSHVGALTVPPIFALEGSGLEAQFSLSLPGLLEADLFGLFTTTLITEIEASLEASSQTDASAGTLNEYNLAAMLSQVSPGMGDFPPSNGVSAPFGGETSVAGPFANTSFSGADTALPRGLEMILDIPLDVTVELGRVRMLIKDVLELSSGSIIELDRVAGEPVDLLVNGRLVAKGEVVVIEDNFGIRITEIISPAERVAGLGKGR